MPIYIHVSVYLYLILRFHEIKFGWRFRRDYCYPSCQNMLPWRWDKIWDRMIRSNLRKFTWAAMRMSGKWKWGWKSHENHTFYPFPILQHFVRRYCRFYSNLVNLFCAGSCEDVEWIIRPIRSTCRGDFHMLFFTNQWKELHWLQPRTYACTQTQLMNISISYVLNQ